MASMTSHTWTGLCVHDSQLTRRQGIAQLEKHAHRLRRWVVVKVLPSQLPNPARKVRQRCHTQVCCSCQSLGGDDDGVTKVVKPKITSVLMDTCLRPSNTLLNLATLPTSLYGSTWMLGSKVSSFKCWTAFTPTPASKSTVGICLVGGNESSLARAQTRLVSTCDKYGTLELGIVK